MRMCFRTIIIFGWILLLQPRAAFVQDEQGADTIFTHETARAFVYEDKGKRDPFWPLVSSAGVIINYDSDFVISDLNLEGVMQGANDSSIAVINGRIVSINDHIGQYVVKEITTNAVILEQGDKIFELKLKPNKD